MLLVSVPFPLEPGFAQVLHRIHEEAGILCAACHAEELPSSPPPTETCVGCHGTMTGPVKGAAPEGPDPHRSPHLGPDEVPICTECHSVHGKSEDRCSLCHRGFDFGME